MPRRRRVVRLRSGRSNRRSSLPAVWVALAVTVLILVGTALQTPAGTAAVGIGTLVVLATGVYVWMRIRRGREIRRRSLTELLALSPADFEVAIATLLKDLGYRSVTRTGGAGDLMADITCYDPQGRSVVVQCKRYGIDHAVSSPEIQQFLGMLSVHHHADRGMYVTTSRFTEPAIALARQHSVDLIDGRKLADLVVRQHTHPHKPATIAERPLADGP